MALYDHSSMTTGPQTRPRPPALHAPRVLVHLAYGVSILVLCGAALAGFLASRTHAREAGTILADYSLSLQCRNALIGLHALTAVPASSAGTRAENGSPGRQMARRQLQAALQQVLSAARPSPAWPNELAELRAENDLLAKGSGALSDAQAWRVQQSLLNLQLRLQEELTRQMHREIGRAVDLPTLVMALGLLSAALLAGAWIYARQQLENEQRTQRELDDLRQRHVLILDSIGEAICGIDPYGVITFVNPAATTLTGWKREDLLGRHLIDFLHARSFHSVSPSSAVLDSLRDGTVQRVSTEIFEQPDGGLIPIEFISTPLRKDDTIAGAVVAFQDITERRRIERMKGEFMAVVSHELRTPLTSLRGALGLLGSGRMGQLPEPGERMLGIALSNAERLGRLVNDILDLEKLNAGRFHLDRKMHNLAEVARQALDVARPVADRAQVHLECALTDVQVWCDADRILQTMINLLGNAVKFSPAGSTVWLEVRKLESQQVSVSVRDQGRGIPADKTEVIFEQFEQVDASDVREKGGTGLGLPICRGIVYQHGGRIWVESTLGRGSTFTFTLPLIPERVGVQLEALQQREAAAGSQD
jgi:PAS domain S-box-containing protein